ncbi:MAG: DegT/DnrJ/EryC1/StrS family aminotransferase [Oscillospiraceae bacterium]|nr:DegT/DnrJ/EryC1/StrS family aminotransferase [Oscillospiraceae bacterium]
MEKLSFKPMIDAGEERVRGEMLRTQAGPLELILGEEAEALEDRLATWVGAAHCLAVSDAATGIALSLLAAGITPGDRVICPALGCALPVQGIRLAGGNPVFADINPNTYTVDPFCLEYAISKLSKDGQPAVRALIATDIFGAPAHMRELAQICENRGMTMIEDLSGAFGARYKGRMTGNFGRFSVASFASSGPLDEMGGGAVFCQNNEDAERLTQLRRAGKQQRLDTLCPDSSMASADLAFTRLKLDCLHTEDIRRRWAAERYRKNLTGKLRLQQMVEGSESVYSQLVVALPRDGIRSSVIKRLFEANIPSGPPLCGLQRADNEWNRKMLVNARALDGRLLALPIHPHLSSQIVDFICESLLAAID